MADWMEGTLKVVINDDGHYSLWPHDRPNAPGWKDAGKQGSRADCLAWIETMWTDMRPVSLRSS
jgi:MbtH protein